MPGGVSQMPGGVPQMPGAIGSIDPIGSIGAGRPEGPPRASLLAKLQARQKHSQGGCSLDGQPGLRSTRRAWDRTSPLMMPGRRGKGSMVERFWDAFDALAARARHGR